MRDNLRGVSMRLFFFIAQFYLIGTLSAGYNVTEERKEEGSFAQFAQSFIDHYNVQPEGRYAHEYHPFLLKHTADSLQILEESIQAQKIALAGRMIILGYEENAMPQYYTDYTKVRINDEASIKGHAGWSKRLHNHFGFMTGFLFRALTEDHAFSGDGKELFFEHILGHSLHLFKSRAQLFQKHAFGQAYNLVMTTEQAVLQQVRTGNSQALFETLSSFWQTLYEQALKTGDAQVAGTQDILFSIAYADHLAQSKIPLLYYVTGPDITYPIEPSCKYDPAATIHAQKFIKILSSRLDQVDREPTAYIFCSFVDGVGKSTTLGNIQNWIKHGNNLHEFEHVDNSSSQFATIFPYKKNTYIVDLPAQISHFTYKPDGLVYVDARTELSQEKIDEIVSHFYLHQEQFVQDFLSNSKQAQEVKNTEGLLASLFHSEDKPQFAFIKNIFLLKKEQSNSWVPFVYENQEYIFKTASPTELRMLVPLDRVKSEGLKNIESEQMLFFSGIKLPPSYNFFIEDLLHKLTQAEIKKVYFIDFMSMYPRSCRENVRINYLLQQIAHLEEGLNPYNTLYRNYSSGSELLAALSHEHITQEIKKTLSLETIIRHSLYKTIIRRDERAIQKLSMQESTDLLQAELSNLSSDNNIMLTNLISSKIKNEYRKLDELFGLSKNFIAIQQFSFEKVKALSDAFISFLQLNNSGSVITQLWRSITMPLLPFSEYAEGVYDGETVHLSDQDRATLYAHCSGNCRDELLLAPIIRMLRATWYALAINFLYSEVDDQGNYKLKREYFTIPPLYWSCDYAGNYTLLQKELAPWNKEVPLSALLPLQIFSIPISKKSLLGIYNERPYLLRWNSTSTNSGIYAYHCLLSNKQSSEDKPSLITTVVQKFQRKAGVSTMLPAGTLLRKLEKKMLWHQCLAKLKKEAKKNGYAYGLTKKELQTKNQKVSSEITVTGKTIFEGHPHQRPGAQLLARLLATIEMVVKDPDVHVGVRFGEKQDFIAALKLFEAVTLPHYFTLYFTEPLFDDYEQVEPFPSWQYWEKFFLADAV